MVDINVRCAGNTHYIEVNDTIVEFTTNPDEIEDMIDEYIEENCEDSLEVNVYYL